MKNGGPTKGEQKKHEIKSTKLADSNCTETILPRFLSAVKTPGGVRRQSPKIQSATVSLVSCYFHSN